MKWCQNKNKWYETLTELELLFRKDILKRKLESGEGDEAMRWIDYVTEGTTWKHSDNPCRELIHEPHAHKLLNASRTKGWHLLCFKNSLANVFLWYKQSRIWLIFGKQNTKFCSWTFYEMCLFKFFLRVRCEIQVLFYVCALSTEPAWQLSFWGAGMHI